jgi:hypothetical protein
MSHYFRKFQRLSLTSGLPREDTLPIAQDVGGARIPSSLIQVSSGVFLDTICLASIQLCAYT